MNEQEIIDNAPKGAAEVCFIGGEAIYNIYPFKPIRNIADIKRIVELEANQERAEKLIFELHEQVYDSEYLDNQVELYEALKEPKP
jgi:hypothetical protein